MDRAGLSPAARTRPRAASCRIFFIEVSLTWESKRTPPCNPQPLSLPALGPCYGAQGRNHEARGRFESLRPLLGDRRPHEMAVHRAIDFTIARLWRCASGQERIVSKAVNSLGGESRG